MANQNPAYLWYPKDWKGDPLVQRASIATRGVWREVLDQMHLSSSYQITATVAHFARLIGCTKREFASALSEIKRTGIANVTECNGDVTLLCRRLLRLYKARKTNRERVSRFRARDGCDGAVMDVCGKSTSRARAGTGNGKGNGDKEGKEGCGEPSGGERAAGAETPGDDPRFGPEVSAIVEHYGFSIGHDGSRTDARLWIARRLGLLKAPRGQETPRFTSEELTLAVDRYAAELNARGSAAECRYKVRNFFNRKTARGQGYCEDYLAPDYVAPAAARGGSKPTAEAIAAYMPPDAEGWPAGEETKP